MTRAVQSPLTHTYIGRFAPSPSGPLHMGSLVCALASYLDAKANQGKWLVRIEDIDPPRELPGADTMILEALLAHGLGWDGEPSYQSQHSQRYDAALELLENGGFSYPCICTRKRVAALGKPYDGHCLGRPITPGKPFAMRLNMAAARQQLGLADTIDFEDRIQGPSKGAAIDDLIIHRKDGFYAYQLAVVADDIAQGITDIVRGYDLFDLTTAQIVLVHLLGGRRLRYSHIPVLTGMDGCKLSKQSHAQALNNDSASANLIAALSYLQHPPPGDLQAAAVDTILAWGIKAWTITKLSMLKSVTLTDVDPLSLSAATDND